MAHVTFHVLTTVATVTTIVPTYNNGYVNNNRAYRTLDGIVTADIRGDAF
jgi:hypothetical protein